MIAKIKQIIHNHLVRRKIAVTVKPNEKKPGGGLVNSIIDVHLDVKSLLAVHSLLKCRST